MEKSWEEYEQVYTQATFFEALKTDIALAVRKVLLYSPYLTVQGFERLDSTITGCIKRGVPCCIFVERPKHWEERDNVAVAAAQRAKLKQTELVVRALESVGAHVTMLSDIHEKIAIIDDAILYDGSLNILSWSYTNDRMTRFLVPIKALDTIQLHQIICKRCNVLPTTEDLVITSKISGSLIALRRKAAGLTRQELASRVGIGRKAIYNIECGKTSPRLDTFIRIAHHLGRELLWMPPQAVQNVTRVVTPHLK